MFDFRRALLWVIFSFALILLWDRWQVHQGSAPTFFPTTNQQNKATPLTAEKSSSKDVGAVISVGDGQDKSTEAFFNVKTDLLSLRFSNRGGALVYAELLKYKDAVNQEKNVVLLDKRKGYEYFVQSGILGDGMPDHRTTMNVITQDHELKEGADELLVRMESEPTNGVQYIKTWRFHRGKYEISVDHEIRNLSPQSIDPRLYLRILRDGKKPEGESSFYFTFTGPVVYSEEGKYQKIDFSAIDKNSATFQKTSNGGYVAVAQHYFVSSWILGTNVVRENFVQKIDDVYAVGVLTNFGQVVAGGSKAIQSTLYIGPQLEKTLEKIEPGLELVKDYGWFTILAKPLYWLLYEIYQYLQNWGWSIVALVVLLKAALFWLNAKAYRSMAKLKAVNPKIMEMRERLKDNPQQMQQEMMKIYREEKVNPMGGCLPMIVQIPVFIALYWVLLSSVEMRGAPWILWITDLSSPDPYYILPVVMTATTVLQTWLNPTPADPMQAKLMWFMPLAFSVMFFFFPAGLVLYWITNNVLTIAQQWYINKQMGVLK